MLKTLYAEQKKRHRFIEQSFRLCGRRRVWDVSREHSHILKFDFLFDKITLLFISLHTRMII